MDSTIIKPSESRCVPGVTAARAATTAPRYDRDDVLAGIGKPEFAELLERYGARVRGSRCTCPMHGGDNGNAGHFNVRDGVVLYNCFTKGCGGNAIDLVMQMERCDFPEALKSLGEHFGVTPRRSGESFIRRAATTTRPEPDPAQRADRFARMKRLFDALARRSAPEEKYLKGRGISFTEGLCRFNLGGTSDAEVDRLAADGYRIALPLFDPKTGDIVSFQFRRVIDPGDGRPKVMTLTGPLDSAVFGVPGIVNVLEPGNVLAFFEGLTDTLAALSAEEFRTDGTVEGTLRVIGLPGATAARKLVECFGKEGLVNVEVLLALDQDKAGDSATDELARDLVAAGAKPYRVRPRGKDVAEDFRTDGEAGLLPAETLARLYDSAIAADEYANLKASAAPTGKKDPTFYTLLDLERNPPPPVEFIVEPLLAKETLDLLFGKAFGGKSLFALQTGLHAAAGVDFLEFTFPRPLRVDYLDEEMGLPLLSSRIEKMKSARPEFREPDVLARFGLFSRAGLRLDDPKKLEFIRRKMGEFPGGPPDLCFLDTLRRMHGAEEKDSGEMSKIMDVCSSLVEEFKTTLVPIHHSKKGPNDDEGDWREAARGSGDLVAASQTVIALWKSAELLFSTRADVKAAGEIQPFPMILDPATLLYRRQTDEERLATKEKQKESAVNEATAELCRSLRKLKERSGDDYSPSWRDWRDASKGNLDTLASAREALLKAGTVRKVKRQGRGGGDGYRFFEDCRWMDK